MPIHPDDCEGCGHFGMGAVGVCLRCSAQATCWYPAGTMIISSEAIACLDMRCGYCALQVMDASETCQCGTAGAIMSMTTCPEGVLMIAREEPISLRTVT